MDGQEVSYTAGLDLSTFPRGKRPSIQTCVSGHWPSSFSATAMIPWTMPSETSLVSERGAAPYNYTTTLSSASLPAHYAGLHLPIEFGFSNKARKSKATRAMLKLHRKMQEDQPACNDCTDCWFLSARWSAWLANRTVLLLPQIFATWGS